MLMIFEVKTENPIISIVAGAYISKNSIYLYLPYWAYLGRKSGQNTMKEWSEHKINVIFELRTLVNPYIDTLFYFKFFIFFIYFS